MLSPNSWMVAFIIFLMATISPPIDPVSSTVNINVASPELATMSFIKSPIAFFISINNLIMASIIFSMGEQSFVSFYKKKVTVIRINREITFFDDS